MEMPHMAPQAEATQEPQVPPDLQRYRRHIKDGCQHLESASNWLTEAERAAESLERARAAYDERVKSLIAADPKAVELEKCLLDRQNCADLAQQELDYAKTRARESFAAAYEARPSEGKQMLDGRITISIRRSAVGHWDPNAAAKEGKALAQNNPLLFDTLFAPVKSGFKKLLGMGIPISPKVLRIDETVVISFQGGHDMLKAFRNPFSHIAQE